MINKFIVFILIVNISYSLYHYEAYSYYEKTSFSNFQGFKELYAKDQSIENQNSIACWKCRNEYDIISKEEYATKVIFDTMSLIFFLILKKRLFKR